MPRIKYLLFTISGMLMLLASLGLNVQAQSTINTTALAKKQSYTLAGMQVKGAEYLDQDLLLALTGLELGQKINLPFDDKVTNAIRQIWKQELFANVGITVDRIVDDKIFLNIVVEERPRLSKYNFRGITKSEATELDKKIGLVKSRVVTEAVISEAVQRIKKHYNEKGFGNVDVQVKERKDSSGVNLVVLTFDVNKGSKTKINYIGFAGNDNIEEGKLRSALKATKERSRFTLYPQDRYNVYTGIDKTKVDDGFWKHGGYLSASKILDKINPYFNLAIFSSSKYNAKKFQDDLEKVVDAYNEKGYRDAYVVADTMYKVKDGNYNINIKVAEGKKYYFGDITWRGNTKYTSEELSKILGIKRGDVYNSALLDSRIGRGAPSPDGSIDISTLYMDEGYLFFDINPIETSIDGDTINFEMRIVEGKEATIKRILISGNDRTSEHVVRREIRTLPGNKFSKTDIIRTIRELSNLGYFDAEKIVPLPKPNQSDGTVDIEYNLTEKSNDQLQLQLGLIGRGRFYGTVGVQFNNFSIKNIFRTKYWDRLPIGDGQRVALSYSANGISFSSLNFSFIEPWLTGKKPQGLSVNFANSFFSANSTYENRKDNFIRVIGGGIALSNRLKWPDDNFVFTAGLNYNYYQLQDYALFDTDFPKGNSHNINLKLTLSRYTVDQPLYPRSGSNFTLSAVLTPPYSLLRSDQNGINYENPADRYRFIEMHKYRFTGEWYKSIVGNLVFKSSVKMGFMGYYNSKMGYSPFERFTVGGSGMMNQSYLIGREIIAHRGYDDAYMNNAIIFNKYQFELRYPITLSPASTIYVLGFADVGNAWTSYRSYNPFKLRRSVGLGVRLHLPMFGLLGLDYGVALDEYNPATGMTRLRDLGNITFTLGFEPE